ncbi:MAG: helix-turn-helix transcriptional regulator [Clostridia bacterium]|nr:helix-turn-helix transcriptional regulator [Clostridia bacterium]
MKIGYRIKELRKEKELTQTQLAKLLNISQDSISLWERDISLPTVDYVIELCQIFNVSADYLLCLKDY